MTLPLLLSVPHAGLRVPPEVEPYCTLVSKDIIADGDEQAAEIYALSSEVRAYVAADVARAIVDLNRSEDDRCPDGVVKTHTCLNVPVYDPFPPENVIQKLLEFYYRPYHARLSELADAQLRLGVDCHTMLAIGPPIGPGPGQPRPRVCLSNADATCPAQWLTGLQGCFGRAFGSPVSLNDPFHGGHIIRSHAHEMPWVQLEISRANFMSVEQKRQGVLDALGEWCENIC